MAGFSRPTVLCFSARLYGSRSHKNKKLMDDLKKVVSEAV